MVLDEFYSGVRPGVISCDFWITSLRSFYVFTRGVSAPTPSVSGLTPGVSAPSPNVSAPTPSLSGLTPSVSAVEMLRSIRPVFIDSVSEANLGQLIDKLMVRKDPQDCPVITDGERDYFGAITIRADKAREVIDTVRKKGETASAKLIRALCQVDPCLSTNLNLR